MPRLYHRRFRRLMSRPLTICWMPRPIRLLSNLTKRLSHQTKNTGSNLCNNCKKHRISQLSTNSRLLQNFHRQAPTQNQLTIGSTISQPFQPSQPPPILNLMRDLKLSRMSPGNLQNHMLLDQLTKLHCPNG